MNQYPIFKNFPVSESPQEYRSVKPIRSCHWHLTSFWRKREWVSEHFCKLPFFITIILVIIVVKNCYTYCQRWQRLIVCMHPPLFFYCSLFNCALKRDQILNKNFILTMINHGIFKNLILSITVILFFFINIQMNSFNERNKNQQLQRTKKNKKKTKKQKQNKNKQTYSRFGLVLWHINHRRSLMPNQFLYLQTVLFQTIQFSISIVFCLHTVKCQNSFNSNSSVHSSVLFDPYIGPYQVLPPQARVDQGAMAMKGYNALSQSSSITGISLSDCLVSYLGHSSGNLNPLQRSSRCILQPLPTGQHIFFNPTHTWYMRREIDKASSNTDLKWL